MVESLLRLEGLADCQSAKQQIANLRYSFRPLRVSDWCCRSADWQSAVSQVANLRALDRSNRSNCTRLPRTENHAQNVFGILRMTPVRYPQPSTKPAFSFRAPR